MKLPSSQTKILAIAIILTWLAADSASIEDNNRQQALRGRQLPIEDHEFWLKFIQDVFDERSDTSLSFSLAPSSLPSLAPTNNPTTSPSTIPSSFPSDNLSEGPSFQPSAVPSKHPSEQPSQTPTEWPTVRPSAQPSMSPSASRALRPSSMPTGMPSIQPSESPTQTPTGAPTKHPTNIPSQTPTVGQPSQKPSEVPTISPTEEVCLATCDFLNVSLTASAPFSNGSVSITNEISTCSEEKEFPGATDTDQQTPFASIGPFCNESLDQACAVVNIDALLCSALDFNLPLVHVVAYSAFNESNVEQNYLGDGLFESFQILLEPQEKFFLIGFYSVVVSQDFLPCVFRVSVDVGQCTPSESPSEQPVSPTESPTTAPICEALPQTFTNTGETTNGRLERNDTIPSTCEGGPRPFPGTYGSDPRLFNIVGPLVNDNPNTRCATLIWDFGDCFVVADTPVGFNVLIHPSGKLGHR